jgi:colanic acid/amylovoran biosynthesis glycosyltransferase
MKIAIVVQGRFHAFDLGKALIDRGHDVTLFTNYPKWAVEPFGFPATRVRSFWIHGMISKGIYRLACATVHPERWLNPVFGRWVANELAKERWDVIHGWSGVSEELYSRSENRDCVNLVMRGSAHIRTQDAILQDEERRTGIRLDRPDDWSQRREEREYELADRVVVLSTFARDSFVGEGVDPSRLRVLFLGADTETFRPIPDIIESRCQRILSGAPLRVLYVGALSLQKGLWDARSLVRRLEHGPFHFRFVGPARAEGRSILRQLRTMAEVVPKVAQRNLPTWYSDSDIFLFPTLQDGFAVVLAQAQASGLPILTTPNCCGPDLIDDGETGWILPIRNPEAFVQRLLWCDANRPALAEMVRRIYDAPRTRSWDDVAGDFESLCADEVATLSCRAVADG